MEIDNNVIKRYLEGKEKKGDKDQIMDWFSDTSFEKDLVNKYRIYWDKLKGREDIEDCDGSIILGRIYHKMKNEEFKSLSRDKVTVRFLNVVKSVAAILFIPLVAYLWVLKANDVSLDADTPYSEIYAPMGTRTMFHLPDGSKGWLNGGSYLEFPTEFRGKSREVFLKGEAFFDVLTNEKKPFVVKEEFTDVIAYGTTFNVQAYQDDSEICVTLVSGNLRIVERKDGRSLNLADLQPGQMCAYHSGTSLNRVERVDVETVMAWKDGKLAFRDESFTGVVKKINRWYNVELIIMDEALKDYSYQATFMDETLDEVLKLLQHSAPIVYKDLGRIKSLDGTFEKRKIELYYKYVK